MIFGREIDYNVKTGKIEIDPKLYFDKNGKNGITDSEDLKTYIVNIYKTIMYRGIRGTFIYACNKGLRDYLKGHIHTYEKPKPFRIIPFEEVKPYVNAIPLLDITAAAGGFSDLQIHEDLEWIEPPFNITAKKGYFVCKVVGESMNKIIPNGSYCLFKQDEGGSRNGKVVLVQHSSFKDAEFGAGYTVKEYHSKKSYAGDGSWRHAGIVLKPLSDNMSFKEIALTEDVCSELMVKGVFERVIYERT